MKHLYCAVGSDVNNDLTFKAKDKDKDQTYKDKDQDKDCILVLKESLRPRTRTRTNITGCGHASSLSCILTTFSADTMTSSNSFSTDLINGHFTVMSVYLSGLVTRIDIVETTVYPTQNRTLSISATVQSFMSEKI